MSLTELPRFELYEEGSQIRRSSCDETREHLELLRGTGSLKNEDLYDRLELQNNELGRTQNQHPASSIQHQE